MKVKLMEVFDHLHLFSRVSATIYGKKEVISLTCVNLLWKPTACTIRFVFAITSHGPIVLMCSDLQQDPLEAVELYCLRTRIEGMFAVLKQVLGAFRYRFWSMGLARHSRSPKPNKTLQVPATQSLDQVKSCWMALERFVNLGCIACGLLQLLSLKFEKEIWGKFGLFLRTRSRELPSERTTKEVVRRLLQSDFSNVAPSAMMREIREGFQGPDKEPPQVSRVRKPQAKT